jgi:uncharacterized protein with PQ loop repeat
MATLETILTLLVIIFLQGSSIPQFIKNYKTKSTKDISIILPIMIVMGYLLALIIALRTNNIYFQILYGVGIINFTLLAIQIVYYRKKN